MKRVLFILIAIAVIIGVLGCATGARFSFSRDGDYPSGTFEASPKIRPEWAKDGMYFNDGKLYIVGHAETNLGADVAEKNARENAYSDLAKYAGFDYVEDSYSEKSVKSSSEDEDVPVREESYSEEKHVMIERQISKSRIVSSCSYQREDSEGNVHYGSYIKLAVDDNNIVQGMEGSLTSQVLSKLQRRIETSSDVGDINFYLDIKNLLEDQ